MSYCLVVDIRKQSYWLNPTEKGNGGHDQLTQLTPRPRLVKLFNYQHHDNFCVCVFHELNCWMIFKHNKREKVMEKKFDNRWLSVIKFSCQQVMSYL